MQSGTCRLCLSSPAPLHASHIVPEFLYKRIYSKKHRFTAIAREDGEQLAVEQKGFREFLLCQACETKLSKWEGKLSPLVTEIATDSFVAHKSVNYGTVNEITGVDYAAIKLAVLSIFWRMHLSTHPVFGAYDLGPHAEELRRRLDAGLAPGDTEYPIVLTKGLLDSTFLPGILFPMERGRYEDLILQSVVLNGIVFECVMTHTRTIPKELMAFSLSSSGRMLVDSRSYDELGMNLGDFTARFKSADVKTFYQKHG